AFTLSLGSTTTGNASAITGVGANSYIITGNTSGAGKLTINRVTRGSDYIFPIGTLTDYLPATINPSVANSTLNWSANVFTPATTDATYGSGNNFSGTSLADIVNAVWIITPSSTSPQPTATLTLNWTSDLEGSSFSGYSNGNIGISHYSAGVWQNSTATGGANNATNTVTSQFTSFSPFGVGSIGNPLPISLINFTAVLNSNNTVSLSWQTTVEVNSDHFDIERSSDGSTWNSIGTVDAQGNSQIVVNYSYLDASPASGVNYYRLNMVDKNGSHSYSNVEVVTMNSIGAFRIFPNPAKDFVNVTLDHVSGSSTIRLFNFSGQTVFTQQLTKENGNAISIPVQNLAQGTYMLQVSGAGGSLHTGKVIIVR
ncbi:MAG TPA: T9SS type A sorting domain-containing protein, partial [Puia sp.]|nr:T9SS type A sorting domain-containing protein [Puia sp.]